MSRKPPKVVETKIDQLTPDDLNANMGSERGNQAIEDSLRKYGAGRSILIDKNGKIIAGNKTIENAGAIGLEDVIVVQTTGDQIVAVQRMDLDMDADPKARELGIADNRASELSLHWDAEALSKLSEQGVDMSGFFTEGELRVMIEEAAADLPQGEPHAKGLEAEESVFEFKEAVTFPSSNRWGIPDLLPDMLAKPEDVFPITSTWGGSEEIPPGNCFFTWSNMNRPEFQEEWTKRGILAWFVEDMKFESIWNDAVEMARKLHRRGWLAICEPDFSVEPGDPLVCQLWNLYRSRWCARYWQGAGIKVIPNVTWGSDESLEYVDLGFPDKLPVSIIKVERTFKDKERVKRILLGLDNHIQHCHPQHVILHGATGSEVEFSKILPEGPEYHFISDWNKERAKVVKQKR